MLSELLGLVSQPTFQEVFILIRSNYSNRQVRLMYITQHSISRATRLQLHPNHLTMQPVTKPGAAQRAAFLPAARAGLGVRAEFVCWDVPVAVGGNGDAISSLHHTAHESPWTDGGEQGDRFLGHQLVHAFCIPPKHEANPAGCALHHAQSFLGPQEPKHLSARRVWAKKNKACH